VIRKEKKKRSVYLTVTLNETYSTSSSTQCNTTDLQHSLSIKDCRNGIFLHICCSSGNLEACCSFLIFFLLIMLDRVISIYASLASAQPLAVDRSLFHIAILNSL
jgi:hypothetical protein